MRKGQKLSLSEFLRKLDDLGYEKVLETSEPGEFSQRGGIIDVFPINSYFATRIDFLGNNIETIEKLGKTVENEKLRKEILKKRLKSQKLFSDLKNLKPGDCLVHLDHGIGTYRQRATINNEQYYELEYANKDKLFVPVGLERKLSRYIGFSDPKISGLSSLFWQKTKQKIKESAEKMAKELWKFTPKEKSQPQNLFSRQ